MFVYAFVCAHVHSPCLRCNQSKKHRGRCAGANEREDVVTTDIAPRQRQRACVCAHMTVCFPSTAMCTIAVHVFSLIFVPCIYFMYRANTLFDLWCFMYCCTHWTTHHYSRRHTHKRTHVIHKPVSNRCLALPLLPMSAPLLPFFFFVALSMRVHGCVCVRLCVHGFFVCFFSFACWLALI